MTRQKNPIILHPFLFTIHPILFLLSRNMDEVAPVESLRPMVIALAFALIGFLLLRKFLKDAYKAALLVTIAVLMFFLYSPLYLSVFRGLTLGGFIIGRHRVLLVLCGLFFMGCTYLVSRIRARLPEVTGYLNIFGIILVSLTLFNIAAHGSSGLRSAKASHTWKGMVAEEREDAKEWIHANKPLRDIYYIILDAYAREDTLKEFFGYDNSAFVISLRDKGFYVASDSRSIYDTTYTSLASSLNFDYLENVVKSMNLESAGNGLWGEMVRENKTCRLLKDAGYTFVFFPTVWQVTCRNPNADIVLSPQRFNMSEFDRVLLYSSPLQAVVAGTVTRRNELLYLFESLETIPEIQSPTFTFAHISCPHDPYVFDKNGNLPEQFILAKGMDDEAAVLEMHECYINQLIYLNNRIEEVIDNILTKSDVEPIIILQSDHGPPAKMAVLDAHDKTKDTTKELLDARQNILNAYYLPDGGNKLLNQSISPANSFRVVFNHYFGACYEMLDDTVAPVKTQDDTDNRH